MAMCRPRGGRSAPRYHHVRDASEQRLWRLMHPEGATKLHQEQEQPEQEKSEVDKMCETLAVYTLAMDSMLAQVKEKMK